ncbi:MAG: alpha-amylase, partial [Planctomycetota bacterium]
FVPNHVGLDNPWAATPPDWFFRCDASSSTGKAEAAHPGGPFLKHGKDPYFPPWPDTFQLNLFHPAVRSAQQEVIASIATLCDGVRCDMAMLPLPDVFLTTWGHESIDIPGVAADQSDYWPGIIKAARDISPGFQFLAECYWDREWDLMCQGFDYCYDKRLYERLAHGDSHEVSGHLMAEPRFLYKCAHFLENHDEDRSTEVFKERLNAAAVVTYLSPGLRFFHHGQEHGFKLKDSVHLSRAADERRDPLTLAFYKRLLTVSSWAANRPWKRLQPRQAWEGNPSHGNLIAMQIGNGSQALLAVVNYSSAQSQGSLALESGDLKMVEHDLETGMASDWLMGNDSKKSINFDLGPWKHRIIGPAGLFPAFG